MVREHLGGRGGGGNFYDCVFHSDSEPITEKKRMLFTPALFYGELFSITQYILHYQIYLLLKTYPF